MTALLLALGLALAEPVAPGGAAEPTAPDTLAEPTGAPAHDEAPSEPATAADEVPGLAEAPALAVPTDESEIYASATRIARRLRCPVCQGLSANDSQAESAVAMRSRAAELVRLGYSDEQIFAFFTDRYGEWVLLEPPRHGWALTVWLAPLGALGLGGAFIGWLVLAARRREREPAERAEAVTAAREDDPYRRRILEELES